MNLNNRTIGTITPASGWTLTSSSFVAKVGRICEPYLELTSGAYAAVSTWNTVATLPEGFRPIFYFDGAYLDNASGIEIVDVKFSGSGAVQVYKASASTSNNIRIQLLLHNY